MTIPVLLGIGMRQAVDEDVRTKLFRVGVLPAALSADNVWEIVPLMTLSRSGSRVRSDALDMGQFISAGLFLVLMID